MMRRVLGERKHGFMPVLERIAGANKISVEQVDIKHEVGVTAGEVYKALEGKGEVQLRGVRENVGEKGPLFAAALGWLLHEDKIELKATKDGIKAKLK